MNDMLPDKFEIIIPPPNSGIQPELLQRLSAGDPEAFAWVYKQYRKRLFDYALLLTGCASTSEDVLQEVFIKLWRYREKLSGLDNFNGYLYAINRSHILEGFRKKKAVLMDMRQFENIIDRTMSPVQYMEYRETEEIINRAVKNLSPQRKAVFQLREQGLKIKEICAELSIFPSTAKTHLKSAKNIIKKVL